MKDGMTPALVEFIDPEVQAGLATEVRHLTIAGNEEAYYVPAVHLIVQSTLNVMDLPTMRARMPRQILQRSGIAIHAAKQYTNLAITMEAFTALYTTNPALASLSRSRALFEALADREYMETLGGAPFFDSRVTIGGAFNFLDEVGIPSPERKDIIVNSPALLAISGVYKGNADRAITHLGTPYANTEHYALDENGETPKVTFTEATRQYLKSLGVKDRGCPAGKINLIDRETSTEYNLLYRNWRRIVGSLISEDAST